MEKYYLADAAIAREWTMILGGFDGLMCGVEAWNMYEKCISLYGKK